MIGESGKKTVGGGGVSYVCMSCGAPLSVDEIGLYKKMINRGAQKFLCIECLSKELSVSVDELRSRIEYFRRMGCTLFL